MLIINLRADPALLSAVIDSEDNPKPGGKRECYDVGNIDSCLDQECEKAKKGQDPCKDTGPDGKDYDFRKNNSNHFINGLLKACGSNCELTWRGRDMNCDGKKKKPDPTYP